jgi:hypothetical protein
VAVKLKKIDKRYEKTEDAVMRLDNSVVRWHGIPVFLQQEEGYLFAMTPLDGKSEVPKVVDANDMELDISSPELGFVNLSSHPVADAVYVARIPARRYKQGVDGQGLRCLRAGNNEDTLFRDSKGWAVPFKDLDKTIRNEYPTAAEAYQKVTETEALGVAFSRKFAFSKLEDNPKVIRLLLAKETVGFVSIGRKQPTVTLLEPWSDLYNMASTLAIFGIVTED